MALADVFAYHPAMGLDPLPTKPWRLDGWLWASNGHVLVAHRDDGRDADETPEGKRRGGHYFTDTPVESQRVSFAALRDFCGAVRPADEPCEDCRGSGREWGDLVNCEHCGQETRPECRHCGGDGKADLERRYARVCGVAVNLTLLAYALTEVQPTDEVRIGRVFTESKVIANAPALVVDGADWRIVLMSLRDVSPDVPTFGLPTEGDAVKELSKGSVRSGA